MRIKWHNDCESEIHTHIPQNSLPGVRPPPSLRPLFLAAFLCVTESCKVSFANLPGKMMKIPNNENIEKLCVSCGENKDTLWGQHRCLFCVSGCACLTGMQKSWQGSWLSYIGWKRSEKKIVLMCPTANLDQSFCWLNRNNATDPRMCFNAAFYSCFIGLYWLCKEDRARAGGGHLVGCFKQHTHDPLSRLGANQTTGIVC